MGKIKTVIQIIAIISALLQFNLDIIQNLRIKFYYNDIYNILSILTDIISFTVIITVISGIDYFVKIRVL